MSEKKYLLLLKKQLQNKRVICGYNQNDFGQTVITTGSPRKYNDDKITNVKFTKLKKEIEFNYENNLKVYIKKLNSSVSNTNNIYYFFEVIENTNNINWNHG